MDILISNATIVTMDEAMHIHFGGHLGITGEKITYIGKDAPKETPEKIIDGTGMVLMPGLINCHTHLATTLLRGAAEDCSQGKWFQEHIFPRTDRLDKRAARAGIDLALAECLRFGITSVSDLCGFPEVTAEAVCEAGMKANIALPLCLYSVGDDEFDFETDPACMEFRAIADKWHGFDHGRIRIDGGLQGEYTGDYRLWEPLSRYAAEKGLGIQVHLSESKEEHEDCLDRTGLTPAQLLSCHHVADTSLCAVGCAALEKDDMTLLGRKKASGVVLPVSSMKFAHGVAPVTEMVKAGMNVALGTDSAAANNNLDLFEEMKVLSLAAKIQEKNPEALPSQAALMMATVCGARAQGRSGQCGMLKVGLDADMILVDFTAPHLMPSHDVYSSLVYSARGNDVAMTMVRGKVLYAGGKFLTIDLSQVVREMSEYALPQIMNPEPQ